MKKRHGLEQIVRQPREADARLAAGVSIPEVAGQLGISESRPPAAGGTSTAG